MKITSRNVNGIRAVMDKGFLDWMRADNPDILCLQETKAFEHQMPAEFISYLELEGYSYCRHAGTRAGYAGTAIFWRRSVISDVVSCNTFIDNDMFYEDGRVTEINLTITHDKEGGTSEASDGRLNPPPYGSPSLIREDTQITLLNCYFPNGGTRADGTEMLTYKLKFYDCLIEYIQYKHASGRKVIVVGDYNICHTEIDIARPKENQTSIGFLTVERDKVSHYLSSNDMVDVFRHLHPDKTDEYTWWSYRAGARPNNVGRRIDYVTVSRDLIEQVTGFEHQTDVVGSDHCPVSVIVKGV